MQGPRYWGLLVLLSGEGHLTNDESRAARVCPSLCLPGFQFAESPSVLQTGGAINKPILGSYTQLSGWGAV